MIIGPARLDLSARMDTRQVDRTEVPGPERNARTDALEKNLLRSAGALHQTVSKGPTVRMGCANLAASDIRAVLLHAA